VSKQTSECPEDEYRESAYLVSGGWRRLAASPPFLPHPPRLARLPYFCSR
jgi:hypothetical protein